MDIFLISGGGRRLEEVSINPFTVGDFRPEVVIGLLGLCGRITSGHPATQKMSEIILGEWNYSNLVWRTEFMCLKKKKIKSAVSRKQGLLCDRKGIHIKDQDFVFFSPRFPEQTEQIQLAMVSMTKAETLLFGLSLLPVPPPCYCHNIKARVCILGWADPSEPITRWGIWYRDKGLYTPCLLYTSDAADE